jgi:hypothetical protein
MKRWLAIPLAIAVAWLLFTLSPLWALYKLADAVRHRDAPYVEAHVNLRTLRLSLVRQIVAAVREALDADPNIDAKDRQRLNDLTYGLALAFAETLVTPETVIDMLDDGWPEKLDLTRPPGAHPMGLNIRTFGRLGIYYAAAEMRGFRAVVIPIPPEAPRAERTRIRLRLRGFTWRLADIELASTLRNEIAAKIGRALTKARIGAGGDR